MEAVMYQPPEGYLTLTQARERLGVSRATMYNLMRRTGLLVYGDPRNRRVRLVQAQETERLRTPVPEGGGKRGRRTPAR